MENNKNLKSFVLYAKRVVAGDKKFIACQSEINGKWYKIKFRQDCEKQPKKVGLYNITIDMTKCSVERGKRYINSYGEQVKGTDTIWVTQVENLEIWTEEKYQEKAMNDMSEVFGE